MKKLIENLERRINDLETEISNMESSIKTAPLGVLHVHRKKDKNPQYYNKIGDKAYYITKAKSSLVKELAQKQYDEKQIKILKEEKVYLEELLEFYKKNESKQYDKLTELRKNLVEATYVNYETLVEKWKNSLKTGECTYSAEYSEITENGEKVCSRIEKIDADMFKSNGVYYVYESTLRIDENTIYFPDFRIFNPRTGMEYIYEHFGKMASQSYVDKTLKKIHDYAKVGFVLGYNFYCDFDGNEQKSDSTILRKLIEAYFKP